MAVAMLLPISSGPSSGASKKLVENLTDFTKDKKEENPLIQIEQLQPNTVRRPTSGTELKQNTNAYVTIVSSSTIKLLNKVGGNEFDKDASNIHWTDWLLQSVTERRAEKTQIINTFGDPYLYVFGEQPRLLSFSGILINTDDFNWRAEFWENWDNYMRASKLLELNAKMYIGYDDILVEGYPIEAVASQNAMNPSIINFQFQFFVTKYINTYLAKISYFSNIAKSNRRLKSETLDSVFFKDKVYEEANEIGKYMQATELAYKQFVNTITSLGGVLGGNDQFTAMAKNLMFSRDLLYIKGAKSALDILNSYLFTLALQGASLGVEALSIATGETFGALIGLDPTNDIVAAGIDSKVLGGNILTYMFGLISHLWELVAGNVLRSLPADQKQLGESNSPDFINHLDRLFRLGSPTKVAQYLVHLTFKILLDETGLNDAATDYDKKQYGSDNSTTNKPVKSSQQDASSNEQKKADIKDAKAKQNKKVDDKSQNGAIVNIPNE